MIIHRNALSKVWLGKEMIIAVHTSIPKMGTSGTNGVVKGRTLSGSFLRMIHTPAHTNTNAKSVPMLVRSPATLPGTNAEKAPTKNKKNEIGFIRRSEFRMQV